MSRDVSVLSVRHFDVVLLAAAYDSELSAREGCLDRNASLVTMHNQLEFLEVVQLV